MKHLWGFLVIATVIGLFTIFSADVVAVDLISAGQPHCQIIAGKDIVEQHAAAELQKYLARISGVTVSIIAIEDPLPAGLLPVRFVLISDANVASVPEASRLQYDGYLISASSREIVIASRKRRGFLYGVYQILRDNGVYWFHPGADGELCPQKDTVTAINGTQLFNPALTDRKFGLHGGAGFVPDTYDWLIRNGMQVFGTSLPLQKFDPIVSSGGHILQRLLLGKDKQEELLAKQPELFGLQNGQRVGCGPVRGQAFSQPCTSNPETVRRMIATLKTILEPYKNREMVFALCNDDHQRWCECDECTRLDPTEEKIAGLVSTRWWHLVNQLSAAISPQEYPNLTFNAYVYQNFVPVPIGIKPDPRVQLTICGMQRCYFHALADPNCQRNAEKFRSIYESWSATGLSATNFEYHTDLQGPSRYIPCERAWVADMKFMHGLGMCGAGLITRPPDGNFKLPWNDFRAYNMWYSLWQLHWLAAYFAWHIDDDYETVWNKVNELYYGPAWPAMREYRLIMERAMTDAKAHCFWGGNGEIPLGRAYIMPGVEAKLLGLLAKAETLVADDQLRLARVKKDQLYLEKNWADAAESLIDTANRRVWAAFTDEKIVIDGKYDEQTWHRTQTASAFYLYNNSERQLAKTQTKVKMAYDKENLYVLILADVPEKAKLRSMARDNGRELFLDSHMEIFLSNQNMQRQYYMFAFNWKGKIYQAKAIDSSGDNDFNIKGRPELGIVITPQQMIAEVRLPVAELVGMPISADIPWRVNVARQEELEGGGAELSSLCYGFFHGAYMHWPLLFEGLTAVPVISNGGFEELGKSQLHKDEKQNWEYVNGIAPKGWMFNTVNRGKVEVNQEKPFEGLNCLRVEGKYTFIEQKLDVPREDCAEATVSARVRGKGELFLRLQGQDKQRYGGNIQQVNSDKWMLYEDTIACPAPQLLLMRLHGKLDLDDVRVIVPPKPGKPALFLTPSNTVGQFEDQTKIGFRISAANLLSLGKADYRLRYRILGTGIEPAQGELPFEPGKSSMLNFDPLPQKGYLFLVVRLFKDGVELTTAEAGAAQGIKVVGDTLGAISAAKVTVRAKKELLGQQ